MMTLHWSPRSPFVRKVMIAVHEMGLEAQIDRIRTVVAPTKVADSLLLDNPLSKLPTLVLEDGSSLFDSRVIFGVSRRPSYGDAAVSSERVGALDRAPQSGARRRRHGFRPALAHRASTRRGPAIAAADRRLPDEARRVAGADGKGYRPVDEPAVRYGHLTLGTALGYLDFRFPGEKWRSGHADLATWHATFLQVRSVFRISS